MKISVILCTFNRCLALRQALGSIAGSVLPPSVEWEVLAIDNNSQDQTREVVEKFCQQYPGRFRYLFEPRQGKSYALNTGIREARGKILAFMDDDVTVEPDWLRNLTVALDDTQWAGAGGRILPEWSVPPPAWLPLQEWYGKAPLVIFDLGPEAGPLTELPIGTNMAFRKEIFEKYGGFRTDLGPCPGSEIRGEDSEFSSRILAAGERLRYEPSAVVHHSVSADRVQRGYFLRWWFARARSVIMASARPTEWCVAGIPLYLFRKLVTGSLRWMIAVGPSRRFSRKLAVWFLVGQIAESYRQSRLRGTSARPEGTAKESRRTMM